MNTNQELFDKLEKEELKIASFKKRFLAYIVDSFVILAIVSVILFDKINSMQTYDEIHNILMRFAGGILILQFVYHSLFTYLYGATLGKMLLKIMVIDQELLDKPNLIQSVLRASVRQVSDMLYGLGFAWALSNIVLKTWHDYVAKTVVIDLA
ncbi:RDD family protein [Campylobacter ornithocola]|uniref:RDD family protein n=1 Tax=Campylobacter ornithocola TaxID=1848766 RepID=A0A6M8MRJ6_9BACT|nr:RDD family protein [Campylobacter ornithocola]OCX43498.1 RDD family protein [Campylobacter ornithocola]QKF57072.1 RDD family protein [Campylobacter ornithocola]